MKYFVYYDGYGNAKKAVGEAELAESYGSNSGAFLKAMLGSQGAQREVGGRGYVSVVNFDTEQERDEYLENLGEQISSYGGCRSQCQ